MEEEEEAEEGGLSGPATHGLLDAAAGNGYTGRGNNNGGSQMPGFQSRVLSVEAVLQAKELYEERVKGRRVWSILRLADHFGVGESTMFRALHKAATFQASPDPLPRNAETTEAAKASLEKLMAGLTKEKEDGKG